MRARPIAIAILLVVSLGVASCSTGAHGTGHLAGAASPTVSAPAFPTPAPSGSATTTPSGGGPTQNAGTGSGGTTSSPKPKSGPPKVTGTINPLADYSGTDCPYTTAVTGTVSVDHGPTSVRVGWNPNYVSLIDIELTLNFPRKGPQSAKVSMILQPPPDDGNVSVTLEVDQATKTIPLATAGFTMTCKAKVSKPMATKTSGACPYSAVWTSTVAMSYADSKVTYEWDASNMGKIGGGTLDFTKSGSITVVSPSVSVLTRTVGTDFVVTLKVTSPDGGFNASAARCTSVPAH